jgi:phenylacetyl-CoA:acceptor oxidoreductase 27-kDa subunit
MIIDLRKCFGCGACVVACAQANRNTPNHWRRVFDCGVNAPPQRSRLFLPLNCMHCGNPPCESVCPTTATFIRPDGIVDIDYDKCIGCGYCIVACPYYARVILFSNEHDMETRIMSPGTKVAAPEYLSVASKCCFCRPRIERGIEKGLTPGMDEEATPACVNHCTAGAIQFGDLNDPNSEVARMKKNNQTICLQESLGTQPFVFYIGDPHLKDSLE